MIVSPNPGRWMAITFCILAFTPVSVSRLSSSAPTTIRFETFITPPKNSTPSSELL